MARLRASWRTSLPVVQQPRNPQSESIARSPYEASGTTASIWKHQSGSGPAEDGRLNERERPWLRSVIGNRPKVLTGRSQTGTRVGSSAAITDDGGKKPRRTIGRNLPIRLSTLDNRVSPIRPTVATRWYPDRKEGHGGGGRGTVEQAKAAL